MMFFGAGIITLLTANVLASLESCAEDVDCQWRLADEFGGPASGTISLRQLNASAVKHSASLVSEGSIELQSSTQAAGLQEVPTNDPVADPLEASASERLLANLTGNSSEAHVFDGWLYSGFKTPKEPAAKSDKEQIEEVAKQLKSNGGRRGATESDGEAEHMKEGSEDEIIQSGEFRGKTKKYRSKEILEHLKRLVASAQAEQEEEEEEQELEDLRVEEDLRAKAASSWPEPDEDDSEEDDDDDSQNTGVVAGHGQTSVGLFPGADDNNLRKDPMSSSKDEQPSFNESAASPKGASSLTKNPEKDRLTKNKTSSAKKDANATKDVKNNATGGVNASGHAKESLETISASGAKGNKTQVKGKKTKSEIEALSKLAKSTHKLLKSGSKSKHKHGKDAEKKDGKKKHKKHHHSKKKHEGKDDKDEEEGKKSAHGNVSAAEKSLKKHSKKKSKHSEHHSHGSKSEEEKKHHHHKHHGGKDGEEAKDDKDKKDSKDEKDEEEHKLHSVKSSLKKEVPKDWRLQQAQEGGDRFKATADLLARAQSRNNNASVPMLQSLKQKRNVKTLYHQTSSALGPLILAQGFKLGKVGWCGGAIYFARSPRATFGKAVGRDSHHGYIIKARVDLGRMLRLGKYCKTDMTAEEMKQRGVDSIVFNPEVGDGDEYAIYDSKRVLSMECVWNKPTYRYMGKMFR